MGSSESTGTPPQIIAPRDRPWQVAAPIGEIQLQTVFDEENNHYLLMIVGWNGVRREHGCLVHVDRIDGKFWIQRDGTEHGIASDLLEAGVPKDRIVLAFRSVEMRKLADFAVT